MKNNKFTSQVAFLFAMTCLTLCLVFAMGWAYRGSNNKNEIQELKEANRRAMYYGYCQGQLSAVTTINDFRKTLSRRQIFAIHAKMEVQRTRDSIIIFYKHKKD
jgi:hypothetical protein